MDPRRARSGRGARERRRRGGAARLAAALTHVVRVSGEFRVQDCASPCATPGTPSSRAGCATTPRTCIRGQRRRTGHPAGLGDGWEDELDGPLECMHANNICVTHVETLSRSYTFSDFVSSGYDSVTARPSDEDNRAEPSHHRVVFEVDRELIAADRGKRRAHLSNTIAKEPHAARRSLQTRVGCRRSATPAPLEPRHHHRGRVVLPARCVASLSTAYACATALKSPSAGVRSSALGALSG